jgi:hypothetical protein
MKRLFFANCRVEIAPWGDHEAFDCDDAEVWIEGDSILVSYFDEDGIVVLEGNSDHAGGWTLGARSRPRRARLLPLDSGGEGVGDPGADGRAGGVSRSYRGSIVEQGESGRWTLHLGVPASED